MAILGIDIGGSGVKGALVDPVSGTLLGARFRLPTPQPAEVSTVVATVAEVARGFPPTATAGITFPGVVVAGTTRTAANLDGSWLDAPAQRLFADALGRRVTVLNDADAAGLAEVAFGAGRDVPGVVIMLTFGTGIGSALFVNGVLAPNTELGHLELHGRDAEEHASDRVRELESLDWPQWASRVQDYLRQVERLFQPDLLIIGGGVSKKAAKYLPLIDVRTPMVPAALRNNAGIVGAAVAAGRGHSLAPGHEANTGDSVRSATPQTGGGLLTSAVTSDGSPVAAACNGIAPVQRGMVEDDGESWVHANTGEPRR